MNNVVGQQPKQPFSNKLERPPSAIEMETPMTANANPLPVTTLSNAIWDGYYTAFDSMNRVLDQFETLARTGIDQAHENRQVAQRAAVSFATQVKTANDAALKMAEDAVRLVAPYFPALTKVVEHR